MSDILLIILGMISAVFVLVFGPIIIFVFARQEYRRWKGKRKPYIWDTDCDCIGECVIPEHQYQEATDA